MSDFIKNRRIEQTIKKIINQPKPSLFGDITINEDGSIIHTGGNVVRLNNEMIRAIMGDQKCEYNKFDYKNLILEHNEYETIYIFRNKSEPSNYVKMNFFANKYDSDQAILELLEYVPPMSKLL